MSAPATETKLDFWPDEIRVDVLTPFAILRTQQGLLSKKTHGLLEGRVTSEKVTAEGAAKLVQHIFYILAPALERYQEPLLIATHGAERVYPVTVKAQCFNRAQPKQFFEPPPTPASVRPPFARPPRLPVPEGYDQAMEERARQFKDYQVQEGVRLAKTEEEFKELVREVLHSQEVISSIQDLIARSNEARAGSAASTPTTEGDGPEMENV